MDSFLGSSDNSDDKGNPNEFLSGISNEATNERNNNAPMPSSVSSGHNINSSDHRNELTSVADKEVTNESPNHYGLTSEPYEEGSNEIPAQNGTLETYEEFTNEIPSRSKLTAVSSEGLSSANTALTELKSDGCEEVTSKIPSRSELTAVSSEGLSSANTALSELTTGTSDGVTKEIYDSNVLKKVTCVTTTKESIMERLSRFHEEEDEDIRFLNSYELTILFRPLRLIILIRVFHLAHQKRHLEKLARRMVSGNKRRYKKDGFDLDLTYVTERIIAMSFPSSGKESFYRNPIKEVVRFLDTKHQDHYQVYNLCSEGAYDPKYFHCRVQRIMIDDHNVPTLR
ncbi:uncharacterized protein LOC113251010 [Ursus arctos]|uniref:uncharacterized protein LOC113251010 n=1 Tax=Ursus arctos TaxID=9644 RepID=UPI002018004D|nr:uncharacterized protein LOC113251010 [Ursus arctos]